MTVPDQYSNVFLPIRSFLASHRAFRDGSRAVEKLEQDMSSDALLLSDWKIHWVSACTLLRSAITLFQADRKICVGTLADGVKAEWEAISNDKSSHAIFWEFLREERNNILKEYRWSAYERYLDSKGQEVASPGLIVLFSSEYQRDLAIRGGAYGGRPAIDVVKEARDWVELRILSAIDRAGLDPDEERNIVTFSKRPPPGQVALDGVGHPD